jgi:hypothetical protein
MTSRGAISQYSVVYTTTQSNKIILFEFDAGACAPIRRGLSCQTTRPEHERVHGVAAQGHKSKRQLYSDAIELAVRFPNKGTILLARRY